MLTSSPYKVLQPQEMQDSLQIITSDQYYSQLLLSETKFWDRSIKQYTSLL